jgi:hypothetical protein
MGDVTSVELKAERVRGLGEELGSVFHARWNEVVQLRWEWRELRTLYAQERAGTDTLNEHAPAFFWLVQHALSGHVLSTIANLTDPPETGSSRQPNLTVHRLPPLARAIDAGFGATLETLIREGASIWKPIRTWRNKQLAHLDLDVALERRAEPLPLVQRTDVDSALAALTDIIHAIDKRLQPDADTRYDVVGRWGGADALLSVLREASEASRHRR